MTNIHSASEATLSGYDPERLRARLNHDLLKNRLTMRLHKLKSLVKGDIEWNASIKDAVSEVMVDWALAKEDISRLQEIFFRYRWFQDAMALPFVRNLEASDRQSVRDMLLSGSHDYSPSEKFEQFTLALEAADTAISMLEAEAITCNHDAIEPIDAALISVRAFSECIGTLRLSI